MHFTFAFTALVFAVLFHLCHAAPVVELDKRDPYQLKVCIDKGYGRCLLIDITPGLCRSLNLLIVDTVYNDAISSFIFEGEKGMKCEFYKDTSCRGGLLLASTTSKPDFGKTDGADNQASSLRCDWVV